MALRSSTGRIKGSICGNMEWKMGTGRLLGKHGYLTYGFPDKKRCYALGHLPGPQVEGPGYVGATTKSETSIETVFGHVAKIWLVAP